MHRAVAKKNSGRQKILPPHHFSNGPSLSQLSSVGLEDSWDVDKEDRLLLSIKVVSNSSLAPFLHFALLFLNHVWTCLSVMFSLEASSNRFSTDTAMPGKFLFHDKYLMSSKHSFSFLVAPSLWVRRCNNYRFSAVFYAMIINCKLYVREKIFKVTEWIRSMPYHLLLAGSKSNSPPSNSSHVRTL